MSENNKKDVIDITEVWNLLKAKKKVFFIVLPIVFVLSCLYIFPQPRYYRCSVKLAPEATSENMAGGLSTLASQFALTSVVRHRTPSIRFSIQMWSAPTSLSSDCSASM